MPQEQHDSAIATDRRIASTLYPSSEYRAKWNFGTLRFGCQAERRWMFLTAIPVRRPTDPSVFSCVVIRIVREHTFFARSPSANKNVTADALAADRTPIKDTATSTSPNK
jgi:hypothetical protein